ncbi:hypothetical protein CYLTODRAFT_381161 [Cylindrobasidium torrendii FP15055 ss-10]|uniref:Mid2 domain-containing protein n=1 Tax=Cylindrobasidium torrendii FP15055 ss-10 TaxID=1314674 RepID=A0A0D7B0R6_9AGAR|nr:hypothetical protein CYLTODRAFT_381161 [Cylindrobasidium torrendii FP15055 ss-10]
MIYIRLLVLAVAWVQAVSGFNTTWVSPSECDDYKIEWEGGTAPFYALLVPVFGTQRNISIPDSAYSNGKGSYTVDQLPFKTGRELVITMSDSTGFSTGGISPLMKVGTSTGGKSCDTTEKKVDFTYELNSALQQCRVYSISNFNDVHQPATIYGIIPNGEFFEVTAPKGATSYDWTADVWNGTQLIILVTDADGRAGGSSDVKTVGMSDDQSCMSASSPSVTGTATPSSTAITSTSKGSTPIGAIAGTVLGVLLFFAIIITLGLFCLRQRSERKSAGAAGPNTPWGGSPQFGKPQRVSNYDVDLSDDVPASSYPLYSDAERGGYPPNSGIRISTSNLAPATGNPFVSPGESSHERHSSVDPYLVPTPTATMSSAQRKATMAQVDDFRPPGRFVLHTDVADVIPPEDDVVDLPPQYSDRRAPLDLGVTPPYEAAPAPSSSASTSHSPSSKTGR